MSATEQAVQQAPIVDGRARSYLTPEDIAWDMNVCLTTVYRLLRAGEMPGRRVRRLWRIPRDQYAAYQRDEWTPPQRATVVPLHGRGRKR